MGLNPRSSMTHDMMMEILRIIRRIRISNQIFPWRSPLGDIPPNIGEFPQFCTFVGYLGKNGSNESLRGTSKG